MPEPAEPAALRAVRPRDPHQALGLAVEFLMGDAAFARLPFGSWARVLVGQINRGHCLFVLQGQRVVGLAGWALTDRATARAWQLERRDFASPEARAGEAVVLNLWKAETPAVNRFLARTLRKVLKGPRWLYARRSYADGRSRPVTLALRPRTPTTTPRST